MVSVQRNQELWRQGQQSLLVPMFQDSVRNGQKIGYDAGPKASWGMSTSSLSFSAAAMISLPKWVRS
jgi:hypothetical protein